MLSTQLHASEQARGKSIRSDRLRTCIPGGDLVLPLTASAVSASVVDTLLQVIEQEPVPIRQLNTRRAHRLETVPGNASRPASPLPVRPRAAELDRYLNDEPIVARPVSTIGAWRNCRAYARRHGRGGGRTLVAGASSVIFALRSSQCSRSCHAAVPIERIRRGQRAGRERECRTNGRLMLTPQNALGLVSGWKAGRWSRLAGRRFKPQTSSPKPPPPRAGTAKRDVACLTLVDWDRQRLGDSQGTSGRIRTGLERYARADQSALSAFVARRMIMSCNFCRHRNWSSGFCNSAATADTWRRHHPPGVAVRVGGSQPQSRS